MQVKIPKHETTVKQTVNTALSDHHHADIGVMSHGGLVLPATR
jgi:hypothetical protein